MKFSKTINSLLPVLLLTLFSTKAFAQTCDSICTDGESCIAAALYPYVPDTETFASSICSAWTASGQTDKLYLIADENVWDGGYSSDPVYTNGSGTQAPIDVFVFDAMYLDYWKTKTVAVPASSVTNAADFVPYARTALTQGDGSMLALPMLGCTNIMFYRDGDSSMDGVTTLPEFVAVNPSGVYISPVPFDGTGAMMDMSGKTTMAVNYMVKGMLDNGTWPSMSPLDSSIVQEMTQLSQTASWYNALTGAIPSLPDVESQYIRAGYFSEGYGRTSIGFSESMSQMSDATRSQLKLKAFPWSDKANAPNMFYADVVGVNSASTFLENGGTLPFALANLMTGQTVVQNAIAPPSGALSYLFPARTSILNALSAQDPLYTQMAAVLNGKPSVLVNMPTTDRDAFHSRGQCPRAHPRLRLRRPMVSHHRWPGLLPPDRQSERRARHLGSGVKLASVRSAARHAGSGRSRAVDHSDDLRQRSPEQHRPVAHRCHRTLQSHRHAVNIGGWFLTDNFGIPKKYRIPNNTTIAANGYLVFHQDTSFGLGTVPFALNSQGEEVFLLSADAIGNLTGWAHGFEFGPAGQWRHLWTRRHQHGCRSLGDSNLPHPRLRQLGTKGRAHRRLRDQLPPAGSRLRRDDGGQRPR